MPVSIVVPQLGESVAEGTVSKWLKAVGDRVRKEEPLVEIQTDKINVEIPSPAEGTLDQILVAEGTTVLVGTEIGTLADAGEAREPKPTTAVAAAGGLATAVAGSPTALAHARDRTQPLARRAQADARARRRGRRAGADARLRHCRARHAR